MQALLNFSATLPAPSSMPYSLVIPIYQNDSDDEAPVCLIDHALTSAQKDTLKDMLANIPAKQFSAKAGEHYSGVIPCDTSSCLQQAILIGLGKKADLDEKTAESIGGKLAATLQKLKIETAVLFGEDIESIDHLLFGFRLRSYNFDRYKKAEPALSITLTYVGYDHAVAQEEFEKLSPIESGVVLARDLVNEAPNVLYPESYADLIKEELKPLGIDVDILDEKKMLKLGMGGIMAVGQGSDNPPRMVIMRWRGDGVAKTTQPLALVGKGVTFDTGGISLKPGPGMDEMKMDMGGSAAVVGTMKALALRHAKAHVVGIVGLAENMPSHKAYRPGDIITTYAGKTIEVLNTDAEGRLVLSDALTYVQEKFDPCAVIDLATLTGAMMVALGHEYCGTFCTHDSLWDKLNSASKTGQEKLWRMPLDEVWYKEVISSVADIRNMGKSRFAGSCTAAAFLQHFIDENREWAHMDIAGTAWIKSDKDITPKCGTGFGVRTLDQLVAQYYETH